MNDPALIYIDDPGRALLSAVGKIDPRSVERLGHEEVLRRCQALLDGLRETEGGGDGG